MDGVIIWLAQIIYVLPGILVLFLPLVFMLLPALSQDSDIQAILATIGGGAALLLVCVWFLYLLAFSFLFPAVQINYARNSSFSACFHLGQIFRLATTNLSDYLLAWIMTFIVNFAVYFVLGTVGTVLSLIPCLGIILVLFLIPIGAIAGAWLAAVYAHLFGQVGA